MNRKQRRVEARKQRRRVGDGDTVVALDRSDLLRIVANMVEMDGTLSGATIITADGQISHVDAGQLRRGGRA